MLLDVFGYNIKTAVGVALVGRVIRAQLPAAHNLYGLLVQFVAQQGDSVLAICWQRNCK